MGLGLEYVEVERRERKGREKGRERKRSQSA